MFEGNVTPGVSIGDGNSCGPVHSQHEPRQRCSVSVSVETLVISPQKLSIFVKKRTVYQIIVS